MEVQMTDASWRDVLVRLSPSPVPTGPGWAAWTLSGPVNFQERRVRRVRLLTAILRNARAWLYYSEDPLDDGVAGEWLRLGPGKYLLRRAQEVLVLHDWLRQGAWVLVVAPRATEDAEPFAGDPFSVDDLRSVGIQTGAELIISAFHDNDPWWVVAPDTAQSTAPG